MMIIRFMRLAIVLAFIVGISGCSTTNDRCSCKKKSARSTYLNVYWAPKSIMTLHTWGVDDIKSSCYQKITTRIYPDRQDNIQALMDRIKTIPPEHSRDDIEPRLINLRLYIEMIVNDELLFDIGTGQSTDQVLINGIVWKDDPDFFDGHIFKIIER